MEGRWRDEALLPSMTVQRIVAHHGDYRQMQWFINRGKNYAMDAYGALLLAYKADADGERIRSAWLDSSNMLDALDRPTALLADVTFTAEEASEDRFCRTLRATKLLTVTAARRYQGGGDTVATMIPPPYGDVVAKLVDSWKHAVDLSTWQALVFPESTRCAAAFLRE